MIDSYTRLSARALQTYPFFSIPQQTHAGGASVSQVHSDTYNIENKKFADPFFRRTVRLWNRLHVSVLPMLLGP